MHELVVLGGGASGFCTAIAYARRRGGENVLIIEGNDRVLKKVALTGNGQCNLSNVNKGKYFGDESLVNNVFDVISVDYTLAFFASIGVEVNVEESGKVYPRSYQASSVSDCLRFEANKLGIKILNNEIITKINKYGDIFEVFTNVGKHNAMFCVYALGGAACPKLLSSQANSKIIRNLGIETVPFIPALVQLNCNSQNVKALKGIKTDVKLSIVSSGKVIASKVDEIHFADGAISGPVVFSLSPYATSLLAERKEAVAKIDFFPELSDGEFLEKLEDRCIIAPSLTVDFLFTSLVHNSIGRTLVKCANIDSNKKICDLTDEDLIALMKVSKGLCLTITDSYGFNFAQSSIGGVPEKELNEYLESVKVPGLFFVGESVNVCGECGGYNLQWAWASGLRVGRHIAHIRIADLS